MTDIKKFLDISHTHAKFSGVSKKRVIEKITALFCENNESLDHDEVFQLIIARERLGSTGIGKGIAIPHCRHTELQEITGVCLTLDEPVDFDAIDSEPVDILFAIMVPDNADDNTANDTHLKALAFIAEKFQNESFANGIRKSQTNESLYALIN